MVGWWWWWGRGEGALIIPQREDLLKLRQCYQAFVHDVTELNAAFSPKQWSQCSGCCLTRICLSLFWFGSLDNWINNLLARWHLVNDSALGNKSVPRWRERSMRVARVVKLPLWAQSVSAKDKLRELKYGTSCQLLTVRHTAALESLDDVRADAWLPWSPSFVPLHWVKKKKCFLLRHCEKAKKKGVEGGSGGCIQLRLSLWLHFPANVMLDCFCLSNTPLSHLFSITAASCIPAAACNPPSVRHSHCKQHNSVCFCACCPSSPIA